MCAPRGRAGILHLWWLGQSGFLLQRQGRFLLMDPYLSDSLTRKYAASDTPHVRMTERVVDPSRLGFVHVCTCSHGHTDHMGPGYPSSAPRGEPRSRGGRPRVHPRRGCRRNMNRPLGMNDGVTRSACGLPDRHSLGAAIPWKLTKAPETACTSGMSCRRVRGACTTAGTRVATPAWRSAWQASTWTSDCFHFEWVGAGAPV